jgi:hypothetical protein
MTLQQIEAILASEGLAAHPMDEALVEANTFSDVRMGQFGEYSLFDVLSDEDDLFERVARERELLKHSYILEAEEEIIEAVEDLDPLASWGDFLAA